MPTPMLMAFGLGIAAAKLALPVPVHPPIVDPCLIATAATLMFCSLGVARSRRK